MFITLLTFVSDLDKREVTPTRFEPVAKFMDTFRPSPSPDRRTKFSSGKVGVNKESTHTAVLFPYLNS